jgi:hypothetical protein
VNRFEDKLWEAVVDRHGDDLARADAPRASGTKEAYRRRSVLAGGTLGVAALGAGLLLAFSGSTAPPAFAITTSSDGSVLVHLTNVEAVTAAERKLASMGLDEWFEANIAFGTATANGPVRCTIPTPAEASKLRDATHRSTSGLSTSPPVEVLLGTDGNSSVPPGQAGAGTWHVVNCYLYSGTFPGTGNTGTGSTGNIGNSGSTGGS